MGTKGLARGLPLQSPTTPALTVRVRGSRSAPSAYRRAASSTWRPTRRSTKRHGPRESREGGSRPPVAGRGLAPSSLRGLIFLLLLAGEKRDVPLAVEAGAAVPEDDVGHFVSDVDRRAAGPGPARRLRPPRRLRARDRREGGPRSPRGSSPALTLPPPDRTFVLEIQPWLPRVSRSAAQAGNARATRIADLLVGEPMDDPVLGIELVADSVEILCIRGLV